MPAAALVGAVAAATFVYALSWRKGLNPIVLILIGIAVSAIGAAGIQFLVIKSSLTAAPALAWLAGSTYARGWRECAILAGALVVLLPLAWLLGVSAGLGVVGGWIGLAIEIFVGAALFWLRVVRGGWRPAAAAARRVMAGAAV